MGKAELRLMRKSREAGLVSSSKSIGRVRHPTLLHHPVEIFLEQN